MKHANQQKVQLEKFLRDIEIYKEIMASIKKFEDDHQNFLASIEKANPEDLGKYDLNWTTSPAYLELILLRGTLQNKIQQFAGEEVVKLQLLTQVNELIKHGGYNKAAVPELNDSLLSLLKAKSLPHQEYIKNRFAKGEEKAQKAIRLMPNIRDAVWAKRFANLGIGSFVFAALGGAAIAVGCAIGITVGLLFFPSTALSAGILAIIGATVGVPFLGVVVLPALVSAFGQVANGLLADKYNPKLAKAQKTVDRAIVFEDTYNFLIQAGINIGSADITPDLSVEQANDPLLSKQQGSVFSIKETLQNRTMPDLNAVQETKRAEEIKMP